MPGALPPDSTRVYDERIGLMGDSRGRGGQAADFPDGTRVYDLPGAMADSGGGRHAGPAAHRAAGEPPVRRRGAESYQGAQGSHGSHGSSAGFGGRGGGLRPEVRRKALITAAVAVPAMLGLSVALAMSSSGKSPDGGAPGPGPAQQTDVPTAGTGTDDTVPPTEPVPTSTSVYGHPYTKHTYTAYPTYARSSGYGSPSSATDPASTGSRSGQPTDTGSGSSSQSGPPSSTNSTSQETSTPPSTPSSRPSSSPS